MQVIKVKGQVAKLTNERKAWRISLISSYGDLSVGSLVLWTSRMYSSMKIKRQVVSNQQISRLKKKQVKHLQDDHYQIKIN